MKPEIEKEIKKELRLKYKLAILNWLKAQKGLINCVEISIYCASSAKREIKWIDNFGYIV